ncbi:MAG: 16S rRNA (guanine(966)-N(2))-methyltransferase RsmD [SAR324 cluster bacterium]|nr:16S rRNA (guanine(966)-N(2))-methyltransferase RsmD [SAR324 cluster bacterium]MBF0351035.1 16S rRNA (guanine(966)-N(2))-methyltransferase RsmD [SAR324 cluster bacterium]
MINIISGELRGRQLKVPEGLKVRPTSNKIRAAMFNVLRNMIDFPECCALDLYAGSGALGCEALSHGVSQSIFVESQPPAYQVLSANITALKLESRSRLYNLTAINFLRQFKLPHEPLLIFLDPPYLQGEYDLILPALASCFMHQDSMLVIESPDVLEYRIPKEFDIIKTKRYGHVKVNFLTKI